MRLNSNLIALQLFNTVCHKDLDGDDNYFAAGSGLICISVATFFKAYDILAHMIVPVPINVNELSHKNLGMVKAASKMDTTTAHDKTITTEASV